MSMILEDRVRKYYLLDITFLINNKIKWRLK